MGKNFSCNLGSINLSEFVSNPYTEEAKFNWDDFTKSVKIAVKALDDIIDENLPNHPLEQQRENAKNYRNIGLGTFAYANCLFQLCLEYGSDKAISFTRKLFKTMFIAALEASNELAKEKGMFPKCKKGAIVKAEILQDIYRERPDLENKILQYGLRNCSLLSIAPNGSIATFLGGASGGCEPEFALKYTRKTDNLDSEYDMYCKSVQEYWEVTGVDKSLPLPKYFVTSAEIPWRKRIDTQAAMQKYIDTAISSTVNLPIETSIKEIEQLYLYAWSSGLKGVTIYRSGCKREGILVDNSKAKKQEPLPSESVKLSSYHTEDDLPWGTVLGVDNDLMGMKTKIKNGCGAFHLQAFYDEYNGRIWETFINLGDGGGCERNLEFISKLISKCLRAGVPIDEIIETAESVRPCLAYVNRTKKHGDTSCGTSCPSAIGKALANFKLKINKFVEDNVDISEEEVDNLYAPLSTQENTRPVCPECGETVVYEGGCVVCKACGWSKCN